MMLKTTCIAALAALFPLGAVACATGAKCISVTEGELVEARLDAISDATGGARWLTAPEPVVPSVPLASAAGEPLKISPLYEPGDILPRGQYSILMNSGYHGLPPAPEGTLYFNVDLKVLLVDMASYEILEDVSPQVAATF